MATAFVQICTQPFDAGGGSIGCNQYALQEVALVPPEAATSLELLYQGGFDPELAALGFSGMLLLWAIGLGLGFVLRSLSRLR